MKKKKNKKLKNDPIFATQVLPSNFNQEIDLLRHKLHSFPNISIDTEFKGLKRVITRDLPDLEIYEGLKNNVSYTNLREIGITVSDNGGVIGGIWRFDFIPSKKARIVECDCIPLSDEFMEKFRKVWVDFHGKVKWFTFSSYVDIAYLVALLEKQPLPNLITRLKKQESDEEEDGFVELVQRWFGRVYDLKVMGKHQEVFLGNNKFLGLEKLAEMIGVKRLGKEHDAASDSLLTAEILRRFRENNWVSDSDSDEGFLYLLSYRVCYDPKMVVDEMKFAVEKRGIQDNKV
ncbi:hypothetical protein SOVF_047370 [Spinacia oleracea]|uniref:Probable CCR4-associated factor 1 homolog 7 n=1 Tax=Spinacia oleracea TaxID=3562 RepID=A0A9R0I300_SPIOL|nr:probable CCR4-associated factor 1 homolog 7 [Spinacia oleracea]KNA20986.1 hypothetical protein SOVF_047370 [Spinacia oleracea]